MPKEVERIAVRRSRKNTTKESAATVDGMKRRWKKRSTTVVGSNGPWIAPRDSHHEVVALTVPLHDPVVQGIHLFWVNVPLNPKIGKEG